MLEKPEDFSELQKQEVVCEVGETCSLQRTSET